MNSTIVFFTAAVLLGGCATTRYDVVPGVAGTLTNAQLETIGSNDAELMASNHHPVSADVAIEQHKAVAETIVTPFDSPPKILYSEFPPYPKDAIKALVQGVVTVIFVVDEQGDVESANVISSPDPRLSEVSLKAIRTWRFTPITVHGKSIKARFVQKFPFRLE